MRIEQHRYDIAVSPLRSKQKRRGTIDTGLIHVGTRSDQLPDDFEMPVLAGHEQRRRAVAARLINRSMRRQQFRDDADFTFLRRRE